MYIKIDNPRLKFQEHLSNKSNNRILFSGKFGTGKSFFLKKYFDDNESNYNVFFITPINYVVGANQDIFEWIKVDLAKQLVTKFLPYKEDSPLTKNFLIQSFVYKNAGSIFEKLISVLSNEYLKTKTGIDILDTFKNQIDEYKKFELSSKDEFKTDFEKLQSFINASLQIKGSIFEDDLTTQIIRVSIEVLRRENKKENVFIVDDLDRLDPEHIFRILNILSAHNDHFDTNKFGFDKVILVCDYDGVENLYKHKYGQESDFDGYIEKFYTYEPFNFSINDSIVQYCHSELKNFGLKNSTKTALSLLLAFFYKEKKLRIRNLSKIKPFETIELDNANLKRKYNITYQDEDSPYHSLHFQSTISNTNIYEIDYNSFDIIKGMYLLSLIFGGFHKLHLALQEKHLGREDYFSKDHLDDLFDSVCIPSHIGKHIENNMTNTFINLWDLDRNQPSGIVNMVEPATDFLGFKFRIPLKWSNQNTYRGGNFFEDSNPIAGLRNYRSDEMQKACNYADLINEVLSVARLINEAKLFHNIKI